jgi:predicted site-specific integrase-resolvase
VGLPLLDAVRAGDRSPRGRCRAGGLTPINSEEVHLGQVAIYCRVSSDDQSCARQEHDLRAFAKRARHKVIGVFKETASGAKNDRAERAKVMALARPTRSMRCSSRS